MRSDRQFARRQLDDQLTDLGEVIPPQPPRGWVRAIREALSMSTSELASRMGVVQSRVVAIEQAEPAGRLQLDTLRRAAEGLGCRLAYVLVPDQPLEAMVWKQARSKARDELAPVAHSMDLEDQRVTDELTAAQVDELARELIDRQGLWTPAD